MERLPRTVPSRAYLSEEAIREERETRERLREIDGKIRLLRDRRLALVGRVRELSAEQKALFDARQVPQEKVERLHEEHRLLGRTLAQLRSERDRARSRLDEAIARAREIRAEINPAERVRPERIRKEIAELEARQQTSALSIDEENALIARLRERSKFLKEIEAREAVIAEHEKKRRDAEAAVQAARAEVEQRTQDLERARVERDRKMDEIRSELVRAGSVVAQIREKAGARREIMQKLDALGREMMELESEGRRLWLASKERQREARAAARAYGPGGSRPGGPHAPDRTEEKLEELLKRGKVTLG